MCLLPLHCFENFKLNYVEQKYHHNHDCNHHNKVQKQKQDIKYEIIINGGNYDDDNVNKTNTSNLPNDDDENEMVSMRKGG